MLKRNLEIITRFPRLSCFVAGLLLKFCFCKGICFPILLIPAFAILLHNVRLSSKKSRVFELGYFFGLGYFSSTLYWIAESFKCVGLGNYGYLAVAVLVLYLSIYPALSCLFAKLFARTRRSLLILFSVFWVASEYLRGILFTGFPWNLIGYASYEIPYFPQIADIFGIYGVSFFVVLITAFLTYKKTFFHAVSVLVLICSYGCYKIHFFDEYLESNQKAVVTLVQPSIPQEDKMDAGKFKENIDKHIRLSLRSNKKLQIYEGKRLIVWPEAAINIPLEPDGEILRYISSALKNNEAVISGCDRYDLKRHLFNSAYVFGSDGKVVQIYDKRHLLPFGEYIPNFLRIWGLKKVTSGIINFSEGSLSRTIKLTGADPFDLLICYEIAFSGKIIDTPESAWILNITNDSWFKDSDGPTQHMKMACFRAIEEGKSVARCANNGISCFIDCNGKIMQLLNTDEIGSISETMPLKNQRTFYSKHRDAPLFLLLLGILILMSLPRRRLNFILKKLN